MSVPIALDSALAGIRGRMRLPDRLPPLGRRALRLFRVIWFAALLLAVIGPAAGLYERLTSGEQNSLLLPGSRAGFAAADEDATRIRFPVGPEARAAGIRPGDDIVAVNGIPVSPVVDMTPQAMEAGTGGTETDYAIFSDILYGTTGGELLLTLRGRDGADREVLTSLGEHHIESASRDVGIGPALLGVVDILHIITYPLLLVAAWILYRRKLDDTVSSILSLAILLTLGTEQPSATFLATTLEVPRWLHLALFDLGNILLLAGILLFPHGRLSPRLVLLLAALPVLFLLSGDIYRLVFMAFMAAAVAMLVACLRRTPQSDLRQQIKWALFGFSGYALFLTVSLVGDMAKTGVDSFASQLLLETGAGLGMGLAFLSLQMGLLVALLRYRLYDAEVVISRSASFAIITILLAAAFAGVMEFIIESMQEEFGDDVGTAAAVVGATIATVLITPLHTHIQNWAERRFQKNLMRLRDELPECVRDLREIASQPELVDEVLRRVRQALRAERAAMLIDGEIADAQGVTGEEAEAWARGFAPADADAAIDYDPADRLFPIRVALRHGSQAPGRGWLLVGRRPDGSVPGSEERGTLVEVADPIARALRVVRKREMQEREVAAALEAQRRRIERLEALLAPAGGAVPLALKK